MFAVLAASTFVAGCALTTGHDHDTGLLDTQDLTTHCRRLWAADQESFRLCQQLQDRNRTSLTQFANARGVNGHNLQRKARDEDSVAHDISACLERWRPDYTSVWRCVQDRVPAADGAT